METDDDPTPSTLPSSFSPLEEDDTFSDEDFYITNNEHSSSTHNRTFSQFARSTPRYRMIGKNGNGGVDENPLPGITHSRSLSQPIPSFSPQRPLIPSANYDHHNQYKKRTKLSSRKLLNFFGDKPPLDICVKEIEKEGLKAMLHSKIPLCYFLYSLLEEYSGENLFFFLEVEQYESCEYAYSSQQFATAQHIYDTYLTRNSQFEVNVDDKVRKSVVASIKSQRDPRHCFDEAKRAIFVLLENSFARFIRSDIADLMRQEIGENTTYYSPKARDSAIFLLFKFLNRQNQSGSPSSTSTLKSKPSIINHHHREKDHSPKSSRTSPKLVPSPPTSPIPSSTSQISQKRHELIRTMIYEFIRTLLEIDIENYYDRKGRKFKNHFHKPNHHGQMNNDDRLDNLNRNLGGVDENGIGIGGGMVTEENGAWEVDYESMLDANRVFVTGLGLELSALGEENAATLDNSNLIDGTMPSTTSTGTATTTPVLKPRKSMKELRKQFGRHKG
ncbi:5725_t:CDS:2 [Acaulospora colombiana]|uniref:5725_t:CDS:1 n=1 Tax=Acaulospora colombiana TaxID=27376 RepID=A0ACA9LCU1_9GLOM|nr:5725_t:CDS:2 [Acaulospora colombiana]